MPSSLSQTVRNVLSKARSSRSRRPSQFSRRDFDDATSDDNSSRNGEDRRAPRRSIFSRRQSNVSEKSEGGGTLSRWPSRRWRQKSTNDAEGRRRSTSRRPHWRRGAPTSSTSVASPDLRSSIDNRSSPDHRSSTDLEHWPSGTPTRWADPVLGPSSLSYTKRQDTDCSPYSLEANLNLSLNLNSSESPSPQRPRSSRSGRRRDLLPPPNTYRSQDSTTAGLSSSSPPLDAGSASRGPSNDLGVDKHDIPGPESALSLLGTPTDLTQFFFPKPWTPERFKSVKKIANAIHGEVRCAQDRKEQKNVVVKVIRNAAVRPRERGELENPLVEIGAMTYLYSTRAIYPVDLVAKLHGVYQDAQYTYLVTEYCSGGELFREVVQRKSFHERLVKAVALQLALALHSLHMNGICHRDVSLENTLLANDKTVRLIDFGQAECIHDSEGHDRRMNGSAGKDYYRAPEMNRGDYEGPPVDVFALGVEIFIMAVGSPPWNEATNADARYRSLTARKDALDIALRKWGKRHLLSDAFVDLLTGIFCSEPHKRPSIQDLLFHPWFAFDRGIWRWVFARGHSTNIMKQVVEVDKYLKECRHGKYFIKACGTVSGDLYSYVTIVNPSSFVPTSSPEEDRREPICGGSPGPPSYESPGMRSSGRKDDSRTRFRRPHA